MAAAVASQRIRVAFIDDHALFCNGLSAVVGRQQQQIEVVGIASSADEARVMARSVTIDVAVLDVLIPHTSGITLAAELHELQSTCRVLALSVIDEPGIIADMLRARACGYALKSQPASEIVDAIVQVAAGLGYLPPTVSSERVEAELGAAPLPATRLTRREREVFELLIRGTSTDDIAHTLAISRRTVETHRHRVMHKLSAHSVAQMQRLAVRHGGLAR
jgi:DNA-binding NarL/FixJ family response regulator